MPGYGPPRGRDVIRTIAANTSSNLLKFVIYAVVTFVMTPVYVRALGDYDYGVWEIVASLIGYFGLLDIGLQPAISRFLARISPVAEGRRWRETYSTGYFLMVAAGLAIGSVFLAWSFIAPGLLASEPVRASRYATFLQLVALQVALSFPQMGLESALDGAQRYVAKNIVVMLHTIGMSVFLYHFINHWDPLLMLCAVTAVSGFIKILTYLWLLAPPGSGSKLPKLKFFDWSLAREMYRFGLKSFVQGIGAVMEGRTDVLIIGSLLGPAQVVFYAIPQALVAKIQGLVWTLTHALMPAFSELDAQGDKIRTEKLFTVGSRLGLAVVTALCGGAILFGGPFIELWVGNKYRTGGELILYVLASYVFISMTMPLGTRYLTALGRHGPLAKIAVVRAVANVAISLVLVQCLGAVGVAIGSLLAAVLMLPANWRVVLTPLGITGRAFLASVVAPSLLPALVMAAVAVAGRSADFMSSWAGLLGTGTAATAAFFITFAAAGLRLEDRRALEKILRRKSRD